MAATEDALPGGAEERTTLHVQGAVRGDRASIEWMIERFSPLLRAQASHRMSGGLDRVYDPEDLVQDVWLRALPRLAGLEPRSGRITPVLVRFLATTLLNRLNSLMQVHLKPGRAAHHARLDADPIAEPSADVTQALSRALRGERKDAIRSAIDALSPEDRAIVVLRGIEQNPLPEVALLLGMRPNTVAQRWRRALAELRQRLPGSIFDDFEQDEEPPAA